MLEGQVAIISSGLLDAGEALALLHNVRASRLYHADQHSYLLYPDRGTCMPDGLHLPDGKIVKAAS